MAVTPSGDLGLTSVDVDVANTLLDCSTDPNAADDQGRTPLHLLATVKGEAPFFVSFLKAFVAKAHADVPNSAGLTPLQVAQASGAVAVEKALKKKAWPLMCLAARIVTAELANQENTPPNVVAFVRQHH